VTRAPDHASARSIPSLTALRSLCLQPRYRSSSGLRHAEQKLDLLQFSSGEMTEAAQLRGGHGSEVRDSDLPGRTFHTCHMALGVMWSPRACRFCSQRER